MIAWTLWSSVVYVDASGNKQMLENIRVSMGHDPQLKASVEFLIVRKRRAFGNDGRLIGANKLFRNDVEIWL